MTSFALDLAWKSALLMGLALLVAPLVRHRHAVDQVDLLRLAVLATLGLPPVTLALGILGWSLEVPGPGWLLGASHADGPAEASSLAVGTAASVPRALLEKLGLIVAASPILLIYLIGVAVVLGRLLAGLALLAIWTRQGEPVTDPIWTSALHAQSAGRGAPRLIVSRHVRGPLSWGLAGGVVLIPADDLIRTRSASAVLAHELAHLARRDWLFLIMSRLLVALHWFNPLAWGLARALADRSEEAADATAAAVVDPVAYAGVLADFAERRPCRVPGAAMGPSARTLARRVSLLLAGKDRRRIPWPLSSALGLAGLLLVGPVAAAAVVDCPPSAVADAGRGGDVQFTLLTSPGTPPEVLVLSREAVDIIPKHSTDIRAASDLAAAAGKVPVSSSPSPEAVPRPSEPIIGSRAQPSARPPG